MIVIVIAIVIVIIIFLFSFVLSSYILELLSGIHHLVMFKSWLFDYGNKGIGDKSSLVD